MFFRYFSSCDLPTYHGGKHFVTLREETCDNNGIGDACSTADIIDCLQMALSLERFYRTQVKLGSNLWVRMSLTHTPF